MIRALVLMMMLTVCGLAAAGEKAQMLEYRRQEPGSEPYTSRLIATKDFLRLDNGSPRDDFILFDRKTQTIRSIVHSEKTIAVITPRPLRGESPVALDLREEEVPLNSSGAPRIAGRAPEQHRLFSGNRLCLDVVAVPGLLSDAVAARREMARVLASEHAATLPSIPADERDPCDLAINIFRADWATQFGLPIHEKDFAGNSQILVNFSDSFDADPALFRLPEGYSTYSISALK